MWWAVEGSNLGPLACEASALTTELTARRPRCAALDYFRRPAAGSLLGRRKLRWWWQRLDSNQ